MPTQIEIDMQIDKRLQEKSDTIDDIIQKQLKNWERSEIVLKQSVQHLLDQIYKKYDRKIVKIYENRGTKITIK